MLPTQNEIPNDPCYKFNYDQVEKAAYKHFERILKVNNLDYNIKLQILEIDCTIDYSEYTIIFNDITCYGNNKPIFEESLVLSTEDIRQLIKEALNVSTILIN